MHLKKKKIEERRRRESERGSDAVQVRRLEKKEEKEEREGREGVKEVLLLPKREESSSKIMDG